MKILVPYDFTPITRKALDHALTLGQVLEGEIELLHIIPAEAKRSIAEKDFEALLSSLSANDREKISTQVRVGDIYKDIISEAQEGGFQLLVMGTHGAKGLQKVMGSRAIRVITSGNTPFVVTQSRGPSASIQRIVMPVDLTKESAQIVNFAARLAKRFEAEIHVVYKEETDEWLVSKLNNNVSFLRSVLTKEGVKHIVSSLNGKKSLASQVITYGTEHSAELFAVAHFSESILPQFDTFSQDMITNPLQIPVLIVNATPTATVKSQYSFLTI